MTKFGIEWCFPIRWHNGIVVGAAGRICHPARIVDGKKEVPYYNYWNFEKRYVLFGEKLTD